VVVELNRVRVIVGTTIEGLAFNGLTTSGLSGPAFNAQIGRPEHLVADTLGNVYFSASTQVFRRNVDGTATLIAGLPNTSTTSGDGGLAVSAGLSSVGGLALDGTGNLYISQDFSNHRIRRVNLGSGIITTFAGTGTGNNTGDGGLATAATLNGPSGMVVVGGVLYVADRFNHRIRAINLSTNIITPFAGNGSNHVQWRWWRAAVGGSAFAGVHGRGWHRPHLRDQQSTGAPHCRGGHHHAGRQRLRGCAPRRGDRDRATAGHHSRTRGLDRGRPLPVRSAQPPCVADSRVEHLHPEPGRQRRR
jgi:hypothetical protein